MTQRDDRPQFKTRGYKPLEIFQSFETLVADEILAQTFAEIALQNRWQRQNGLGDERGDGNLWEKRVGFTGESALVNYLPPVHWVSYDEDPAMIGRKPDIDDFIDVKARTLWVKKHDQIYQHDHMIISTNEHAARVIPERIYVLAYSTIDGSIALDDPRYFGGITVYIAGWLRGSEILGYPIKEKYNGMNSKAYWCPDADLHDPRLLPGLVQQQQDKRRRFKP